MHRSPRLGGKWIGLGVIGIVAVTLATLALSHLVRPEGDAVAAEVRKARGAAPAPDMGAIWTVELDQAQREAIGLTTARVRSGASSETLQSPARIAPNENHYAFITPRAAGTIRQVAARIGQEVKAGDLLAVIDSAEVAEARSDLLTRLQELELARIQAKWRQEINQTTIQLVARIQAGDTPEQIHERFQDQVLGPNREKLVGALAQLRLAKSTMERNKLLTTGTQSVPIKQYQQSVAEYEAALATYQALLDSIGFETKLASDVATQQLKQTETAVRVARERLTVLGVPPEVPDAASSRDTTLAGSSGQPFSVYEVRAPIDGTVLDRATIVPGVAVDKVHQLFTMADLKSVWVEVQVFENDFSKLARGRDGQVVFTTPAYPGRAFEAKVIYKGDLVDDKSRSILLLAQAENPERLLKPGMYGEARITTTSEVKAPHVPRAALLTDHDKTFVFVQEREGAFQRRDVIVDEHSSQSGDEHLIVLDGLKEGDEVVVAGSFKLKSAALRVLADQ